MQFLKTWMSRKIFLFECLDNRWSNSLSLSLSLSLLLNKKNGVSGVDSSTLCHMMVRIISRVPPGQWLLLVTSLFFLFHLVQMAYYGNLPRFIETTMTSFSCLNRILLGLLCFCMLTCNGISKSVLNLLVNLLMKSLFFPLVVQFIRFTQELRKFKR